MPKTNQYTPHIAYFKDHTIDYEYYDEQARELRSMAFWETLMRTSRRIILNHKK